jgi:hypothetical protein
LSHAAEDESRSSATSTSNKNKNKKHQVYVLLLHLVRHLDPVDRGSIDTTVKSTLAVAVRSSGEETGDLRKQRDPELEERSEGQATALEIEIDIALGTGRRLSIMIAETITRAGEAFLSLGEVKDVEAA